MRKRPPQITYANVVATLALFLAVAGGTTAVALNGSNNVDANDIQQGAVAGREVKNETLFARDLGKGSVGAAEVQGASITGGKVKDGTVWSRELGTGSVTAEDIATAAVGADEVGDSALSGADILDESLDTADVDEPSLFNNNSLTGGDIAEGTLFNDDSLTGADVNEGSLVGFQGGAGNTEMGGGELVTGQADTYPVPGGSIVYNCQPGPDLRYTNDSGADALTLSVLRGIAFEDDGIAGNGEIAMSREVVDDDNDAFSDLSINMIGVGNAGKAELALMHTDRLIWVQALSFRTATACEYFLWITEAPR